MVTPDSVTSSVDTSSSTVAITIADAEANRSSSTYGCSRCRLPYRSPAGACSSATSGRSAGTATRTSPVKGQVMSAYSGCSRRMSDPRNPRTGRNGSPISTARSCASTVAQQLSATSMLPSSAARRYAGARPRSCSNPT